MAQLNITIKSIYGKLLAYPQDDFSKILLHLKDSYSKDGTSIEATCYRAHDIRWLKTIAEILGADLIEDMSFLKNKNDEQRWQAEKDLFK